MELMTFLLCDRADGVSDVLAWIWVLTSPVFMFVNILGASYSLKKNSRSGGGVTSFRNQERTQASWLITIVVD